MSNYIFVIPCCDDRYNFHVKPMFDSFSKLLILYGVYVLSMLFVFTYEYCCPSRILYQMIVSFNSTMVDATSGAGAAYPSGAPEFSPVFSGFYVAYSLYYFVVFCRSLFVFFYLLTIVHVVSSVLRYTTSNCPFGIFKLFLSTPIYLAYIILIRLALII